MKKIGLTGGIGVGKTYVSQLFSNLGIPVFNSDIEAKKCMIEDANLISSIKSNFGEDIYEYGLLKSDKLASIVFSDNAALGILNSLVHPVVKARFKFWCNNQNSPIVMKEAAILFESGTDLELDAVICVTADDELRAERLKRRDGFSNKEIENRINQQMPQSKKNKLADYIILNDEKQLLLPQLINIIKEIG